MEAAVAWGNWPPRLVCSAEAYCPRAALHCQSAAARWNWPRLMCHSPGCPPGRGASAVDPAIRSADENQMQKPMTMVTRHAQPLPSSLVLWCPPAAVSSWMKPFLHFLLLHDLVFLQESDSDQLVWAVGIRGAAMASRGRWRCPLAPWLGKIRAPGHVHLTNCDLI